MTRPSVDATLRVAHCIRHAERGVHTIRMARCFLPPLPASGSSRESDHPKQKRSAYLLPPLPASGRGRGRGHPKQKTFLLPPLSPLRGEGLGERGSPNMPSASVSA